MEELAASSPSSNSTNTCPWLWIIEYLASFPQTDPSLLHDVIEAAPEIPEGEGKSTREMVSLKCLQELFACDYLSSTNHNVTRGGPPPPLPLPLRLDLSLGCEDVLQSLLRLTSVSDLKRGGTEFLEWDIWDFIQRKRASMPKCTLEKLKDGTLEVACGHPYATSLKETSQKNDKGDTEPADNDTDPGGWNSPPLRTDGKGNDSPKTVVMVGNSIPVLLVNENGIVEDPTHNGNSVPIKRDRSCLVDNEQDSADTPDDMNAKRLKQDLPSIGSSMEQDSVSPSPKQFVNVIPARMVGDTGDNGPSMEKEWQWGGLGFEDIMSLERGHKNCHVAEQPERSPDAAANNEFQQNQNTEHHNSNIMPQDTPRNGCHQYILLNECGDAEPIVSIDVPFMRNQPTVSVDGTKDTNDCVLNPTASNTFHGNTRMDEAEGSMGHLSMEDMSSDSDEYPHERVEVAKEKDHFLSSQCALGDEYLATADWTEQNLCMKCNKDGQVLVCSAVGCPLVVHENCLGSSAKYKEGKFYCPFCAYSLSISEFLEAKTRASLARKKLTAFIHVESLSENCNERLSSKKYSNLRRNREEDPILNICENRNLEGTEAVEGHACTLNAHQSKEREGDHQEVVPPGLCPDACLVRRGKQNLTATTFDTSAEEKEGEEMIQEGPTAKEPDTPEVQVHTDLNSSHNASREHNRVVSVKKRRAEEDACGEVLEQQVADSSGRPGCATKIDRGETSEDVDNNSGYSMRSRSRNKQYAYPAMPQLRRKRVPWTAEEEEILKEGVQKFSSDSEKNMPWRKILEYGNSVFWNGRTPIDLKDKWRNMCRGKL